MLFLRNETLSLFSFCLLDHKCIGWCNEQMNMQGLMSDSRLDASPMKS
jgi:hypothetical protein